MKKKYQKSTELYTCLNCDYTTSRKSHWNRHILTAKHKMDNLDNDVDNAKSTAGSFVCVCGKEYKFSSGLSKHKKRCTTLNVDVKNTKMNNSNYDNVVKENIELKNEIKKMNNVLPILFSNMNNILKTQNEIINGQRGETTIYANNIYNNKLSINVFLNETCKNAMNLKDFIDGLHVSLDDLEYTKDHGYVKGISNIFAKNLQDLDPTERPIHCSDKKRLQFYIKEENKWEKDMNNEKIDKTIESVTVKQIKQLKEWEKDHPNYLTNDKLLNEWHTMIQQIMGGGNNEIDKNKEQIKKSLGNQIEIKDAMVIKE